ncbi:MAG: ABC transporter ATP-binding protein [Ignavibacteria bacterium]|nr:ABC transporter ATP-binding protein [Ignavibacteria bacterium]
MNIITAKNIKKSYFSKSKRETEVLNDLSFKIKQSEFLAIMGASGVGKSTLLHILGGLDSFDEGKIEFSIDNQIYEINSLNSNEIADFRNKHIGFVFQFHHLLPEFSAIENVMIPALIAGKSSSEARREAQYLLEKVGTFHRAAHKPSELSGGEQQRVAIARALINKPSIILADEPTGNLDGSNAEAVLNLLLEIRKEYKQTLIIATHSAEIAKNAERLCIMREGKIF